MGYGEIFVKIDRRKAVVLIRRQFSREHQARSTSADQTLEGTGILQRALVSLASRRESRFQKYRPDFFAEMDVQYGRVIDDTRSVI